MRRGRLAPAALALVIGLGVPTMAAANAAGSVPAGGRGNASVLDRPRHAEEAIRALGDDLAVAAARNGQSVSAFRALLRSDPTMWVDQDGQAFAAEPIAPAPAAAPTVAAATSTAADALHLHSNKGSKRVIYLDFNGQVVQGTSWNTSWTHGAAFTAAPYDTDGHPSTFSPVELGVIRGAWARVSEDYAPFDVDVTTEEPPAEAIDRSSERDDVYGTRALITNTTVGYSSCGCGGVSFVGTFDNASAHAKYQPDFIFERGVGGGAKVIGEAVSHEVGHSLGLHHDGSPSTGYFAGQGVWAPIMGVGYYRPVSQWSRGEYNGANNKEDDIAVMISHGVALRPDDYGDTSGTAKLLPGGAPRVAGRISTSSDVDAFRFSTSGGVTTINVRPPDVGADLDVRVRLTTLGGRLLYTNDPAVSMLSSDLSRGQAAGIHLGLAAGTYLVLVDGVGSGSALTSGYSDYGSLGTYNLTATVAGPIAPPRP